MEQGVTLNAAPVRMEREGEVAVIVIDNPPVNAASLAVRAGLLDAIRSAGHDPTVAATVIIGAGTTFIAGADIREFGKPPEEPQLPSVIAAIEACAKPAVAAIQGAALGGGFELALGCDVRIATPDAVVGLPEVTLGLIPGAGGTQRLPRLIGLAAAIEIVASGRRVPAVEAQRLGMVDAVVTEDLRTAAVSHALGLGGRKRRVRDLPVPDEPAEVVERVTAAALARAKGQSAIGEAVAAVRNAARLPIEDGLPQERATFLRLRAGEESAALRHLFFAQRAAGRLREAGEPRPVHTVGVVGAGTMGAGIAVCFLDAGLPVTVIERDEEMLRSGVERIRDLYRRRVESGRLDAEAMEGRLKQITPATELAALSDADLVIEAVFEDMVVKQALFRDLDALLKPSAVLASNTSYLDLNALAAVTRRPADVVGLHFFSPAHVMRLVEVVRGDATASEVLATALAVAKRLGKVAVVARVCEGFIGNRIYSAYRTQCEFMLEEGAYPEQVDEALVAFGMAMGPFAVGDLSGLDIAWRTRQRQAATRDPKARHPGILERLCEEGRLGQKAGRGWYRYDGGRRGVPDPEVHAIIEAAAAAKGIARRAFSAEQIHWRALAAMINEAALLLAEDIAERASDVDLVMVNGYGFPAHKGGPLFWASRRPRAQVNVAIDGLAQATGHGFRRGDVDVVLHRLAEG